MHKTAAIHAARSYCSIRGHAFNWAVTGPSQEPHGPSTEVRATSYNWALRIRAGWRAEIALRLMDAWSESAANAIDYAVFERGSSTDIATLVNIGLAART